MDARTLTTLAADAWAARNGCPALSYDRPDEMNRRDRAVDLLGRDLQGAARLVLEHTLVESFLDQRTAQIAAVQMFEPLERKLSGRVPAPGHYNLAIKPPAVLGLKREVAHIREQVLGWIRDTAPRLVLGGPGTSPRHFATLSIPNSALEVTLYRWPNRDQQFSLIFDAPPDSEEALSPSLERALNAKCPKLAVAKQANPGTTSLLLLEIHDIALGNLFDLDAVVQARFSSEVQDAPDHIWLVDSSDTPPSVMITKVGQNLGAAVGERFLPYLLQEVRVDP